MSTSLLRNLRVLDLSKIVAGPLCVEYLGDMGAEGIKAETKASGHPSRWA